MINTAADAASAVKAAAPGETIYLEPTSGDNPDGSYSQLKLNKIAKAGVKIDGQGARLLDLSVMSCSGLEFSNCVFTLTPGDWAEVKDSVDVTFYGCHFIGCRETEVFCLKVIKSTHTVFSHCELENAETGIGGIHVKGLLIEYCKFHDLGCDAFHATGERIAMVKTFITQMHPGAGAHPDTFQMWVDDPPEWFDNGVGPQDIKCRDVLFLRGPGGGPAQGPFLQDMAAVAPYSDVAFERNYILGGSPNGLSMQNGTATFRGNKVGSWAYNGPFGNLPDLQARVRNQQYGGQITLVDNWAQLYAGFLGDDGKPMNPPPGNFMLGPITDQGEALAREYLDRNPDMVAVVGELEV